MHTSPQDTFTYYFSLSNGRDCQSDAYSINWILSHYEPPLWSCTIRPMWHEDIRNKGTLIARTSLHLSGILEILDLMGSRKKNILTPSTWWSVFCKAKKKSETWKHWGCLKNSKSAKQIKNSKQDITICFISLQSNFSGTDHSILPAMVRSPADRFWVHLESSSGLSGAQVQRETESTAEMSAG